MENATKALLIAAAILVAIIIISLGLGVVRQGQEAMQGADMSEAELEAFNSKFKAFEGANVSGSDVNALLSTVLTHNQKEAADGTNLIVKVTGNAKASVDNENGTITRVPSSGHYKVTCALKEGRVASIDISNRTTENKTENKTEN